MKVGRVRLGARDAWVSVEGFEGRLLDAAPWLGGAPTGERVHVGSPLEPAVRWLAPVAPTKILCVGRNYRKHAEELGNEVPKEPLLFFKPPSSIVGPGDAVELPDPEISAQIEHEAEIAVVIGRRLRHASKDEAHEAIFGFTLAADVTARDLQKRDGQWTRAKGMDTFCPVGPMVVADLDGRALPIVCRVNGTERQRGTTQDMIFDVESVLAYASRAMTLEPGDVVCTGTPEGVGPLAAGDVLELESPEIGTLRVGVVQGPR